MKLDFIFALAITLIRFSGSTLPVQTKKLLRFTKTNGYRHASIPTTP